MQIPPLGSCEINTSAVGTKTAHPLNFLSRLFIANKLCRWSRPVPGRMLDAVSLHTVYLEAGGTLHAFGVHQLVTVLAVLLCSSIVRNQEQRPFSFTLFPTGASCNSFPCQNNLNSGFLMRSVLCSAFVKSLLLRHRRAV